MAALAGALLLVAGFVVLAKALRLFEVSGEVLSTSRAAMEDMQNAALSDDEKEVAMQRHAGRFFRLFARVTLVGAASVLLPVGLLWLLDRLGLLPYAASLSYALSWRFLLATTVGLMVLVAILPRARVPAGVGNEADKAAAFQNNYTTVDRLLHRFAFFAPTSQLGLAEMEAERFADEIAVAPAPAPIFVTALPRAGTTLLLDLCVRTGELGSHTYEDMPFLLAPMLWNQFSSRFRSGASRAQERAHGDGMIIDVDSPEAFDEVVWRAFWKTHYLPDRIRPWADDEQDPEFSEFLQRHVRKIVALRRKKVASVDRYISKNNLNVSRVGALLRCFPDAVIVVPFRDPVQHAISLLRQHKNFIDMHARDPFARRYMADIGHYDFGANLRPVDFDGWLAQARCPDPMTLGFWLEYWTAGYRSVLATKARFPQLCLLSYDRLCASPERGLAALAGVLGLKTPSALVGQAATLRSDKHREADLSSVPPAVLEAAVACHTELTRAAIDLTGAAVA